MKRRRFSAEEILLEFNSRSKLSEFHKKFGEGTAFDLDYGKLVIIALLIYIAFFKTYGV